MKRCPQCEFIYEDEQSLCDMDGVLLVMDSRTFPNLQALTTVPAKTQPKRNRAVPAFATLILAVVLGMVYYVSTQRQAVEDAYIPPQPVAATTSNPVPEVNPTPEVQPQPPAEEPKPATTNPNTAAVAPPVKKAAAKNTSTAPAAKPSPEPKKDENKVETLLKKTGRILKKPFKF